MSGFKISSAELLKHFDNATLIAASEIDPEGYANFMRVTIPLINSADHKKIASAAGIIDQFVKEHFPESAKLKRIISEDLKTRNEKSLTNVPRSALADNFKPKGSEAKMELELYATLSFIAGVAQGISNGSIELERTSRAKQ